MWPLTPQQQRSHQGSYDVCVGASAGCCSQTGSVYVCRLKWREFGKFCDVILSMGVTWGWLSVWSQESYVRHRRTLSLCVREIPPALPISNNLSLLSSTLSFPGKSLSPSQTSHVNLTPLFFSAPVLRWGGLAVSYKPSRRQRAADHIAVFIIALW